MKKNRLKIISIILLIVLLSSISITSYAEEDVKESTEIEIYDLETGETFFETIEYTDEANVVESYIPEDKKLPETRIVFPPDDRTRIPTGIMGYFPYNVIGTLRVTWPNGGTTFGTGWMFGPNDVATAGHVLYDSEMGGDATSALFYPGQNNSSLSSTGYTVKNVYVPSQYRTTESANYDYAVCEVNGTPGSAGYFGWSIYGSVNDVVQIIGYPEEHPYEQWQGSGVIEGASTLLSYKVDTSRGDSGAAVFSTMSQLVIGIHSGAYSDGTYNIGPAINREIANIMNERRNN